jgi:alkylhydroperoxidase/carboxymuconolactone decarboxylase family protein YurZ
MQEPIKLSEKHTSKMVDEDLTGDPSRRRETAGRDELTGPDRELVLTSVFAALGQLDQMVIHARKTLELGGTEQALFQVVHLACVDLKLPHGREVLATIEALLASRRANLPPLM